MINVVTIIVDAGEGLTLKNLSVTPAEGDQPMDPSLLLEVLSMVSIDVLRKLRQPPQEVK